MAGIIGGASQIYRTPGYGGDVADSYDQLSAPDILRRVAKPKLGYDDPGGVGEKLRTLAAHMMIAGGSTAEGGALLRELQERTDAAQQQAIQQAQIARMNRPQGVNLGDGGYATYDPNSGQLNVIREPTAPPPQSSPQERLFDQWSKLPDTDPRKAMLARMLPNFQYTAPVIQAQQANRIALKQTPTYSNLHPKAPTRSAPKPPAGFILD